MAKLTTATRERITAKKFAFPKQRKEPLETVHAQLYGEALENLEAQRVQTTFYVCLVCGEVTDDPAEAEHCPICNAPRENSTLSVEPLTEHILQQKGQLRAGLRSGIHP